MQHLIRGTTSLPFLSYEAVFLYQLAVDAGINPGPIPGTKTCCKLRKRRQDLSSEDAGYSQFAASFGLILASIKLADDVRDDRSVIAKIAQWKLKKPIRASFDFFRSIDSDVEQKTIAFVSDHMALESNRSISLSDYVKPTAQAFGYYFSLLARFSGSHSDIELFEHIGRNIGAAIILFDCVHDLESDRRTGSFNPITSDAGAKQAWLECKQHLVSAIWKCADRSTDESLSVWLLRGRFDSLHIMPQTSKTPTKNRRLILETYRQRAAFFTRQGDCDCACDGCGDCGGCDGVDGGCGDGGSGCCDGGDGGSGCCDGGGGEAGDANAQVCVPCDRVECCECCDCGSCCVRESRRKKPNETPFVPKNAWTDEEGSARSRLDPSGIVSIDGKDFPAKTKGPNIQVEEAVRVVAATAAGLIVKAAT